MSDKKISQLPASTTPLAGTETLPVVQSGDTKKVSVADLTSGRAVSAASLSLSGNALFGGATALAGVVELGLGNASSSNSFLNINSAANSQLRLYNADVYQGGLYSVGSGAVLASNGQLSFSVDSGGNNAGYFGAVVGGVSNLHLSNGNLVIGTSGKGIDFSADGQAAGMTSELLDDYEEGTWTPNVGGDATYFVQEGYYTKVGRLVYIRGKLVINALGTGSATTMSGLPFTVAGSTFALQDAISIFYFNSLAVNALTLFGSTNPSATTVGFTNNTSAGVTTADAAAAIFGNNARIDFSGCYQTA